MREGQILKVQLIPNEEITILLESILKTNVDDTSVLFLFVLLIHLS
ncbi:hypothetical protein G9298_30290 (plasmid) [Bacillus thuringiensis]|nr:hypothetical protein G9298_30290 [Bacillus thuringiensis]